VPTLCVQPLVENAVKHGVEASLEPVELSVRSRIHAGRLEIEVINAHTPGATQSASKGTGTGLQNLSERLRLVYDIAADIRIKPEAHQFSVTLWLPI
jgi:LytS/YehU family sensor histidine kinase